MLSNTTNTKTISSKNNAAKGRSKGLFALFLTVSLVSSGIYYVHWEQKDEKEKLREGVRRDKIRLEKKLLEQQQQQEQEQEKQLKK
tara:strand:+ start:2284 stop:2541 length:258 start_codon:yes stop_codon:yes gene_type:complete